MAAIDLLFSRLPVTGQPVEIVFGQADDNTPAAVLAELAGTLPQPVLHGTLLAGTVISATLTGTIPQPVLLADIAAAYLTNTQRPTVTRALAHAQAAAPLAAGRRHLAQITQPSAFTVAARAQPGRPLRAAAAPLWQVTEAQRLATAFRLQDALRAATPHSAAAWQDATRQRLQRQSSMQDARRAPTPRRSLRWQDGLRDRRPWLATSTQPAQPLHHPHTELAQRGLQTLLSWAARLQDARRPPIGRYVPPLPPGRVPCYTPDAHLVFAQAWDDSTALVFMCPRDLAGPPALIVVPIRRAYVTLNSIELRRVDGNLALQAHTLSLSIDVDSWAWSWSATLDAAALPHLQPGAGGDPVEVEARINGAPYRLLVEGLSRNRQFAQTRINARGRGTAAMLDAPYAPTLGFGNATDRTAQQLVGDALTVNGASLGWAVDWHLTDWLVPAGAWSHQGSTISAVKAIAEAAGGYVQPHATAQTLRILPRYPHAPWAWGTVTPDIELPAAVLELDSVEWVGKPAYDRVHVSGVGHGVLGQVTRTGTAGTLVAPMVTDALITHADAARQRGLAILADTGRQAHVSLKLPVLPETGLILPGQYLRRVDGADSLFGIVRSTSIQWSAPTLRQTIELETHA
ncbi:MAG: hypothetical protein JSS18_10060 [Proteobacteria bacterium]|nr:hypothetical protein [Pseudomonadota bacterium]